MLLKAYDIERGLNRWINSPLIYIPKPDIAYQAPSLEWFTKVFTPFWAQYVATQQTSLLEGGDLSAVAYLAKFREALDVNPACGLLDFVDPHGEQQVSLVGVNTPDLVWLVVRPDIPYITTDLSEFAKNYKVMSVEFR
jgi:hypothetical protein